MLIITWHLTSSHLFGIHFQRYSFCVLHFYVCFFFCKQKCKWTYARACIHTTFPFFALSGIHWRKKGFLLGSKGGAYHQCGPGLNPRIDTIHGLNLLLVLSLAWVREAFLQVFRFSPLLKNQHFQMQIWSATHRHISKSS